MTCGELEIRIKCKEKGLINYMNMILKIIETLILGEITSNSITISWERD
ncbi:MAG: hypothetical protein ACP6IP_10810 [Candidatus Njordarchaeia archaeon]